jgi:hypothetical protein
MLRGPGVYTYRKSVWLLAIGATVIVVPAIVGRMWADFKTGDLVTAAVTGLFLLVPASALIAAGRRYVLTDDVLAREFLLGRKEIRLKAVVRVVEKEGFFQQVLRLTDNQSRTLEVPYEQLTNGQELYRNIKDRTAHAEWIR